MKAPSKSVTWPAAAAAAALAIGLAAVPSSGVEGPAQVAPALPAVQAPRAATGETTLRAGAAKMVISGLLGTDDPTYPKLGEYELEDLYMRVIVVENDGERAALIAADLSGIDEGVWAAASPRVATALGAPEENIVMTSTHVHSDRPQGFDSNPGGGRYGSTKFGDWAVALATEAVANLEVAEIGYGTGELHISINRDTIDTTTKKWTQAGNPDGLTDPELNVLTFYRPSDGSPIATYFAYPMHPVNGYLTANLSADFPGAASRYIERAFGDDGMVAVYNQGAGGDINPRWLRAGTNVLASRSGVPITGFEMVRETVEAPMRNNEVAVTRPDPNVLRELFDYETALGTIIGEETIRVMSTTTERMDDPQIWGERDTVTCPGRIRLDNVREGVPGEYTYEGAPDVDMRTGVLAIGDVILAQINAETFVKIGLRIKDESPFTKTMIVTVANGKANSGYVGDYESEYHETFQALGSKLKPGCAEGALSDSLTAMSTQYLNAMGPGSSPGGGATSEQLAALIAAVEALNEANENVPDWAGLDAAIASAQQTLAAAGATETRYKQAIAALTEALAKATAPAAARITTSSVAVTGKAFKKQTKPSVKVTVKLSEGQPKGKLVVYVGNKKVKTVNVTKSVTTVKLPKKYAKAVKVKAVYQPAGASGGTAKTSQVKTIKVKA